MSTAGKVLTVLVLLVMIGWVVMLSGVAQLDAAWGERIAKQDAELKKLGDDLDVVKLKIPALIEEARVKQDQTDRQLRALQADIVAAQRRLSSTNENLGRLRQEVADYTVAAEKANANKDIRIAEKAKLTEDLAKKRDEIAKLKALNAERRTELAQLQDEFKQLLAENTEAAQKAAAQKAGTNARPASTRRSGPSS